MYGVVVNVTINDADASISELRERVVPAVSGSPGFVAGYWVRVSDTKGTSVVVFESEQAAQEAAGQIRPPEAVTLDSVEVGEVVAHA
jgi:heme-degrading monooxygenase HmoA